MTATYDNPLFEAQPNETQEYREARAAYRENLTRGQSGLEMLIKVLAPLFNRKRGIKTSKRIIYFNRYS